jgi:hypothetical protein
LRGGVRLERPVRAGSPETQKAWVPAFAGMSGVGMRPPVGVEVF